MKVSIFFGFGLVGSGGLVSCGGGVLSYFGFMGFYSEFCCFILIFMVLG